MSTVSPLLDMLTPDQRSALNADYASGEVCREEASNYPLVQRGSIRLVRDLYRTEKEFDAFIEAGLSVKVPGQKGYKGSLGVVRLLKKLFGF